MTLKKYIPDFITSMNLVCGLIGVIFAFKSRLDLAFYCMLAAAVFDFLDGLAARLLDAYSDLGRELDSLCDLVSFGVLPGLMLCRLMQTYHFDDTWLSWLPLVLAVFSALRLAKFNVDTRQAAGFLGLPTPASGLLCGVRRDQMAQFSFLMVLVPILGETFLDLVGGDIAASSVGALPLVLGFVAAFLSGLFACRVMIALVRKAQLKWFGLYCLLAGLAVLIFLA